MTDRRPAVALTAATAVTAATMAMVPHPHAAAAAPAGDTALAMLSLRDPAVEQPPSSDAKLQVLVEPAAGRIQIGDTLYFDEMFVHVTLGHLTATGDCERDLLVVVHGSDDVLSGVYDEELEPVGPVERFPDVEPGDVTRLAVAPFPGVDCVDATAHEDADPAAPGATLRVSRGPRELSADRVVPALDEMTVGVEGWPDPTPYDSVVAAEARLQMVGHWGADAFRSPSRVSALTLEVDAGPGTSVVGGGTFQRTDLDLWQHPTTIFEFTVDTGPDNVYEVQPPSLSVSADGDSLAVETAPVPVSMPVPEGWEGTLAGRTWWRPTSYSIKDSTHVGFAIVRFLDDEWAYLEGAKFGFDGEAPETCSEVHPEVGSGCHRYYYDAGTGRLQLDDRRARPVSDPDGYLIPTGRSGRPARYLTADIQLPADPGQRFAFRGSGNGIVDHHVRPGSLVLRPDGSYRLEVRGREPVGGSYRFLDRQRLRLDPGGRAPARTSSVQLYFGTHEGSRRLMGIETDWFSVLRGGFADG